ncbi:MAG: CHC2 zinc finger domain-containing protein [Candidatus Pacebacteria bacterium]|nr:CHC2 zinc finger domain-containing protein [Candidatus Paceibacterota bacterium]
MNFDQTESITLELEKQYESRREWLSEKQWLEIFPEAKEYFVERLEELTERKEQLVKEAKRKLEKHKAYQYQNEFDRWFKAKTISVFDLQPIKEINREAQRIACFIEPPKETEGKLTDYQMQVAKSRLLKQIYEQMYGQVRGYVVRCPFHAGGQEKHPSLNIKGNFYYCHACGATGDAIDFVMKVRGLSFKDAVLSLQ